MIGRGFVDAGVEVIEALAPYYINVLWTIVIRVVNEEIPSHKQLCLSFMFLFVMIDECTQLLPTLHMKMYDWDWWVLGIYVQTSRNKKRDQLS